MMWLSFIGVLWLLPVSVLSQTCQLTNIHSYCSYNCAPEDRLVRSADPASDAFDYCRRYFRFAPDHILPEEWELMFDSHDYQGLVGSVFLSRGFDSDTSGWTQRGGICQYDLRACAYAMGSQNNWVFSQHIKYPPGSTTTGGGYSTEVYLNITIRFSQCTTNPACTNDFVTLYRYDTNSIASETARTNNNNYNTPLFGQGTENTDSRFRQTGSSDVNVVRNFTRTGGNTGFHLGIRDTGTCGQVRRILIYYTPCKEFQNGLVSYPELVRPPEGSSPNVGEACCAPNSHNTSQNLSFRAYSASDGRCERNVQCECDAGYILNAAGTGCDICSVGTYRSLTDTQNECLSCPMNTVRDVAGAPLCECLSGYFRDEQHPDIDCTSPPDPVQNLEATEIMSTSVIIRWTRPEVTGRDDFYYTIEHSDPDNIGDFIVVESQYTNSALTVTYTISGLRPYTTYTIRVTTHNGVSDQDTENAALRVVDTQVQTREGVPSAPQNVQAFSEIVVWGPPAEPNGVITVYQVRFFGSITSQTVSKTPFESYHAVTESNVANLGTNVRVQVRAMTSAGFGEYSTPEQYNADSSCPECPPTSTPPSCPPPFTCSTPTTPTEETCATCHEVTPCPPTVFTPCPPTVVPTVEYPALRFMLGGTTYLDGGTVLITDIEEGDDALLCVTDREDCCSNPNGEFYFPNGTAVGFSLTNSLYRNRDPQVVRLNRRNGALSPLGRYRCEIPDSSGMTRSIFINIASTMDPPTCPSTPGPSISPCPPTSTPTECPPSTCETCPPSTPCPVSTCPPVTPCPSIEPCPTEIICETCPSSEPTNCPEPPIVYEGPLRFTLGRQTYLNNTFVRMSDIGEGANALLCLTDKTDCCDPPDEGEFYFPNGSPVGYSTINSIYRDRDLQMVRLNRRDDTLFPTGQYRCDIPDSSGATQSIYINIIVEQQPTSPPSVTTPPTQSPTSYPGTLPPSFGNITLLFFDENLFKFSWGGMEISEPAALRIKTVGGLRRRRQDTSQLTIEIPLSPDQTVIAIPQENLQEGKTYIVQAELIVNGEVVGTTPAISFDYTASGEVSAIRGTSAPSGGYIDATYIALAIVLTFLLTAIIVALLVIVLSWLFFTCRIKSGHYTVSKKGYQNGEKY